MVTTCLVTHVYMNLCPVTRALSMSNYTIEKFKNFNYSFYICIQDAIKYFQMWHMTPKNKAFNCNVEAFYLDAPRTCLIGLES